mmetsp:Transcript_63790/g.178526  ORF Transcript_63790/g.178526 Transcript_63790/m.178526 type:complete len:255 (-) Transcript_63790:469-1233(-)
MVLIEADERISQRLQFFLFECVRDRIQSSLLQQALRAELVQAVEDRRRQRGVRRMRRDALDPWMLQSLGGSVPCPWGLVQQLLDQLVRIAGHGPPCRMLERDLCVLGGGGVGKRVVATKQDECHNTAREVIATICVGAVHHLWRHVLFSTHPDAGRLLGAREVPGAAEVDDPQVAGLEVARPRPEEEVLRLEIAVANAFGVHVAHATEHLLHQGRRLLLAEARGLAQGVVQVTAIAEVHDEVDIDMVLVQAVHP